MVFVIGYLMIEIIDNSFIRIKSLLKTTSSKPTVSYRDKGSKFIGYLFPARSVEVFQGQLDQIKAKYPDATHHCYAYRIDPTNVQEFAQDDGEPSGTAGLPILNQLKSFEIVNAGLVVVRYYGGTKLGKSGLIEAYGYTAKRCLEQGRLKKIIPTVNFDITYPYNRQNEIDKLKATFNLMELDASYLADVTLTLACPLSNAKQLVDQLGKLEYLSIQYDKLGNSFVVEQGNERTD